MEEVSGKMRYSQIKHEGPTFNMIILVEIGPKNSWVKKKLGGAIKIN